MMFPLDIWEISLLLALTAILLLIASELISPYYGRANILINKNRLKNTAVTISILFLATVAIKIITFLIAP
jgi:hypothetical protein